jgi:hypothetical protein
MNKIAKFTVAYRKIAWICLKNHRTKELFLSVEHSLQEKYVE